MDPLPWSWALACAASGTSSFCFSPSLLLPGGASPVNMQEGAGGVVASGMEGLGRQDGSPGRSLGQEHRPGSRSP